jgi:hypothetical protein
MLIGLRVVAWRGVVVKTVKWKSTKNNSGGFVARVVVFAVVRKARMT